ncbi:MAG: aminomethyl-transferring glycine dehydrogenase subunit GcvPB [Thermoanaerobacteraceae bacterium]|uniref:aminomethyl-transferring glycine dehydrogenase subunit GcvPB n=1 Tax=Thermanaeromonas sp. C210 TaxID=2731925 RepID=UPI00155D52B7|nr:aminomethyl-transferring glycine dehydrogenase subunit GcvPB [Thermanaeromonas sp. C210]MBE3580523.1 aminomethyl-transferring glycine dehydrogenase subunit GcvPB [Thermoanaerobacteraceae bacterium]GFN22344.1 putative glycine dehydrogenase (decarboxylating) subunit 2 [Thermanaeromonas sp. C210]
MAVEPLLWELGAPGRRGCTLQPVDVPGEVEDYLPEAYRRRGDAGLPELSEIEVVRHFTHLSSLNYGVDTGFYPLGSCTMKYNPKVNEVAAGLSGFTGLHPYLPPEAAQGALELMYHLQQYLAEITGMDAVTLQPAAGAHGELAGLLIIAAYHASRGETQRKKVLVPDSAHGTNPASAAMAGLEVVQIPSDKRGLVDLEALEKALSPDTAALMLTNPNTLGLFESDIVTMARMVHEAGGLLYYDGANLNAIMGITRPGDMGFDVVHLNLHKTFSTPHGGGGPGSGPVGVKEHLAPFLPVPVVSYDQAKGQYYLDYERPQTIGQMKAFYGNFSVMVKAYAYIRTLGPRGLKEVSEQAVLNANYLLSLLRPHFNVPYDRICKHEFVINPGTKIKEAGVRTLDIAKRLLDYGFHAPTIYFPLIVPEALMIEPTETEPKEVLDAFAGALIRIAEEAVAQPELLRNAPHNTPVRRLDEAAAARNPVLKWQKK